MILIRTLQNESADIYRKIFFEIADGIIGIDDKSIIRLCNPAAESIFGWQPGQLLGKSLGALLPEQLRERHGDYIRQFAIGEINAHYMGQRDTNIVGRRADGSEVSLGVTILRTQAEAGLMMIAVIRDISDVVSYQRELKRLAETDPMTGLLNRRAFKEIAEHAITIGNRHGSSYSLILFDLDHFKSVNDTYGHDAGDAVISQFAEIIRSSVRNHDLAGRWGGEEFIVFLPDVGDGNARWTAERIRRDVAEFPFGDALGKELHMTVSAGIASSENAKLTLPSLITRADHALYRAKALGRNKVVGTELN
ncbi:MAG: sensor domain-containing diguanylate cyclase [Rhizobium sp.]|nr:sensor domain-containing diguanylate cyclase [Rhizobium sp.]